MRPDWRRGSGIGGPWEIGFEEWSVKGQLNKTGDCGGGVGRRVVGGGWQRTQFCLRGATDGGVVGCG